MKKIDKKQQLSTVYQNWENALNQANQPHPTYNSSNGEYYQDIVMDALRCQNGLCAYTEIQLCPPSFLTPDNWENGRYKNKNRHHNGQLDHFDERLKWKDKDIKKGQTVIYQHKDWLWSNFFVIDSDTNNRKGDKEVDYILKPDGEYYNPFELLEYSPNTHHYIPNTDLLQPVRERIQKMIDVLGVNFPNIHNRMWFWDKMGERMGRIRQMETDFFYFKARILSKKPPKNPLESARSAPSVFPFYPKTAFRCVYCG